ncbi:hypothetical protein M3Y95_00644400 [Aphelenchoides besseyi]|nr:hypothetical protein M3Y95_00644400 [Aphelenchoides besseyi]
MDPPDRYPQHRDGGDESIVFEVLTGVARRSHAGIRFNRLTDDINWMASYMYDIRLCFIAITILVYGVLIGVCIHICVRHKRKRVSNQRRTARGIYDVAPESNQMDYRNQTGQLDDLVSVRSDGQVQTGNTTITSAHPSQPMAWSATRNHRTAAPFMRHGAARHQYANTTQTTPGTTSLSGNAATTRRVSNTSQHSISSPSLMKSFIDRLITNEADSQVKHPIPHITTSEISSHESNGPTSNNDDSPNNNGNGGIMTHSSVPIRALHHRMNNTTPTIVNDTTEM